MKRALSLPAFVLACAMVLSPMDAGAQHAGRVGVYGGIGTDVTGGIAYGAGVTYLVSVGTQKAELGVMLFVGEFKESTTEGIHRYDEVTNVAVFGIAANYLIGDRPGRAAPYFVPGWVSPR